MWANVNGVEWRGAEKGAREGGVSARVGVTHGSWVSGVASCAFVTEPLFRSCLSRGQKSPSNDNDNANAVADQFKSPKVSSILRYLIAPQNHWGLCKGLHMVACRAYNFEGDIPTSMLRMVWYPTLLGL